MKEFVLNKSINLVRNYYDYDSDEVEKVRYGLEAVYLSITKTVLIIFISLLLGILKETLITLILFNFLRAFAFGIHAKKSWQCYISSTIIFIVIPYISIYTSLDNSIYYVLMFLSVLCFVLYAPADTYKRPLINKKKRLILKLLTILVSIIYIILFFNTDVFFKNIITYTMVTEAVLIHPLTYRMFKLPYKNYKGYVFSNRKENYMKKTLAMLLSGIGILFSTCASNCCVVFVIDEPEMPKCMIEG